MTRSAPRDISHLSEAKRALLAKRLKGRSDVSIERGTPAPTRLLLEPAKRHAPYPVRRFIAERLRFRQEGTSDFRMFIETQKSGLDPERFRRAWQALYANSDVMRTRIRDDQLVVAPPDGAYEIDLHDARGLSGSEQQALIEATRQQYQNLTADNRAVEVALIRTADQDFTCFYSFDLLVLDLPSVEFLALRCRKIYEDRYAAKGPFHVQDYRRTEDAYLASRDGQDARRHWEKRIAQSGPRLSARQLSSGAAGTQGYGYLCRNTPRVIWEQGQGRAKARGVSELVAVQVLFTDLLAHLSGQDGFAYETRSFQRLPFDPDIYELLGQFTLGHLTGRESDTPERFVDRVRAEAARMDRDAPFAFFDAASHWQAEEKAATRGAKIVFTNTCNRFEEFVQAGNIPPMRWFGDYCTILQYTPDTALEYVLVENDGDLENHWFVNHDQLPEAWVKDAYNLFWEALYRLCTEEAAWDASSLFSGPTNAQKWTTPSLPAEQAPNTPELEVFSDRLGRVRKAAVIQAAEVPKQVQALRQRIRVALKSSWARWRCATKSAVAATGWLGWQKPRCQGASPSDARLAPRVSSADLRKSASGGATHTPRVVRADTRKPASSGKRRAPRVIRATTRKPASGFERAFLTGATGFFGSHLLGELLRTGTKQVVCHVRGGGVERVVSALRANGLWQEAWRDRISAVPGDLEQPELGLGPAFKRLAGEVDAVFHNGANVNYVLGFKQLRAANVTATQDALRIAEAAGAPFFFISTLRMFDHRLDAVPIREHDAIDLSATMQIGYAHSKVMSERLVTAAGLRGTKTAIFRPGLMCGDGVIGAPNPHDAVSLVIRACVTLGAAPQSPMQVNLTSVAYASKGLVALAQDPAHRGAVWHLVNDTPTQMTRVFGALIRAGYPIEMIPYEAWLERLRAASAQGETSLAPLLGYFTPGFPEETTRRLFDSSKTRRTLAAYGIRHPDINAAYLAGNIRGMTACGFLPDPAEAGNYLEVI